MARKSFSSELVADFVSFLPILWISWVQVRRGERLNDPNSLFTSRPKSASSGFHLRTSKLRVDVHATFNDRTVMQLVNDMAINPTFRRNCLVDALSFSFPSAYLTAAVPLVAWVIFPIVAIRRSPLVVSCQLRVNR